MLSGGAKRGHPPQSLVLREKSIQSFPTEHMRISCRCLVSCPFQTERVPFYSQYDDNS